MIYTELFESIKRKARRGMEPDIDSIMEILNKADLPTTRAVDFYLGYVVENEGIDRLAHYLFHGTQIQRNYCALYFERKDEWELINRAYREGCIDAIQAYSR